MIVGKGNQRTAECRSQDKSTVTADRHSQSFDELWDEGRHVKTSSHYPSGTEPGAIAWNARKRSLKPLYEPAILGLLTDLLWQFQ